MLGRAECGHIVMLRLQSSHQTLPVGLGGDHDHRLSMRLTLREEGRHGLTEEVVPLVELDPVIEGLDAASTGACGPGQWRSPAANGSCTAASGSNVSDGGSVV